MLVEAEGRYINPGIAFVDDSIIDEIQRNHNGVTIPRVVRGSCKEGEIIKFVSNAGRAEYARVVSVTPDEGDIFDTLLVDQVEDPNNAIVGGLLVESDRGIRSLVLTTDRGLLDSIRRLNANIQLSGVPAGFNEGEKIKIIDPGSDAEIVVITSITQNELGVGVNIVVDRSD